MVYMSFIKKAKLEEDAQEQREDIPPVSYDVTYLSVKIDTLKQER